MTPHEQVEFFAALGDCASVYGKLQSLDDVRVRDGYWLALRDLPLAEVRAGLRTAAQRSRWFPRPADIRAYADEARASLRAVQGEPARPACDTCGSSGWEMRYCPGFHASTLPVMSNDHNDLVERCHRPSRHASHTYAIRCHCRQMQEAS